MHEAICIDCHALIVTHLKERWNAHVENFFNYKRHLLKKSEQVFFSLTEIAC